VKGLEICCSLYYVVWCNLEGGVKLTIFGHIGELDLIYIKVVVIFQSVPNLRMLGKRHGAN
jgi:hypothetical protein